MNAIVSFWRLRLNWLKIFHLFICIATVGYIKFYGQNALSTKRSFNLSVSLLSVHLWSIKSGTSLKTNCSPDHGLEKIPHNSENIRAYHTLFRFAGKGNSSARCLFVLIKHCYRNRKNSFDVIVDVTKTNKLH